MADVSSIPIDKLGFDFDGVIADTGEAFTRIACEKYGYCSFTVDDITSFEVQNSLAIPAEVIERIFTEILENSLDTGVQPFPMAVPVLSELATVSPLHVITARPLLEPVEKWFEQFFPRTVVEKVNIVTTGSPETKGKYIRELGLEYFIDDRAETCSQLLEEQITALVYEQPWNRNGHGLQTVTNWEQIRSLVK